MKHHGRTRRVRQKRNRQTGATTEEQSDLQVDTVEIANLVVKSAISGLVSGYVVRKFLEDR